MPRGKTKRQRSLRKRIRVEHEVARSDRADLHRNVSAIAQRQRVQQMSRWAKVHAGEQREIIRRLQQPEMIVDRSVACLIPREPRIGCDLRSQRSLKGLLLLQ